MKLFVFFTYGISIERWIESGLIHRELQIYKKLIENGYIDEVIFLTYGTNDEEAFCRYKKAERIDSMHVVPKPRWFCFPGSNLLYSFLLPIVCYKSLNDTNLLLKTNQMDGSLSAIISKFIFRKKLILRTGFTASLFARKRKRSFFRILLTDLLELLAYKVCDIAIVTSIKDAEYIVKKYKISERKINVIENFIDTETFRPMKKKRFKEKIVFVGRLSKQKNLKSLLKAIMKTDFSLDIYGDGELFESLRDFVATNNVRANFMGKVPNSDLSMILNKYELFILPSFYEGMPKTLIEAMGCGLVCIATDVEGSNELIRNGENGILISGFDSESILEALDRVKLVDSERIMINARKTIEDKFSLKKAVHKEGALIKILCSS